MVIDIKFRPGAHSFLTEYPYPILLPIYFKPCFIGINKSGISGSENYLVVDILQLITHPSCEVKRVFAFCVDLRGAR